MSDSARFDDAIEYIRDVGDHENARLLTEHRHLIGDTSTLDGVIATAFYEAALECRVEDGWDTA